MHGEYIPLMSLTHFCIGSPPHAWGIPPLTSVTWAITGITPTCMGNTEGTKATINGGQGSPPHAWGIHGTSKRYASFIRITPTCMGNTKSLLKNSKLPEDHPHMHGEYTKRSLLRRDPYILKSYFLMSFSASCIVAFASDKALCGCSFSIPYFASIVPR